MEVRVVKVVKLKEEKLVEEVTYKRRRINLDPGGVGKALLSVPSLGTIRAASTQRSNDPSANHLFVLQSDSNICSHFVHEKTLVSGKYTPDFGVVNGIWIEQEVCTIVGCSTGRHQDAIVIQWLECSSSRRGFQNSDCFTSIMLSWERIPLTSHCRHPP